MNIDNEKKTYFEILNWGKEELLASGIQEAEANAFILFEYVFKMNRTSYILECRRLCENSELISKYREAVEKRKKHIPVQYITGTQEFMGFEFVVNEYTLIPRQDTEILVENVIKQLGKTQGARILDMCTGSGCIAVSLAKLIKDSEVLGADISSGALETAKRNAEKLEAENTSFICSDLFAGVNCKDFDCIVSNPPYIRTRDIEELMEEVKSYEPISALDGFEDGLYFYRKITEKSRGYLKEGGLLAYEIGYDQGKEVSDIMKKNGYSDIAIIKDLAGLDRVVTGWLNH